MREEYWRALFWLLVVGSWSMGLIYERLTSLGEGLFLELGRVVSVPQPAELDLWWKPLAYFPLCALAAFILSQVFFGGGAAIFLFSRGVHDSLLISSLAASVQGLKFPGFGLSEFLPILLSLLILGVNLPLCMWAAHAGSQRSIYTLHRLRGKAVSPELGSKPFTTFLFISAASVAAGLVGALMLAHA